MAVMRFSIRDLLWLSAVVVACAGLRADEPGPTFTELLQQPDTNLRTNAVHWRAYFHSNPQIGEVRNLLVISWFVGDG